MYGVNGLSLVQMSSKARLGGLSGVASYSRKAMSSEGKTSAIDMLLAISSGMIRERENLCGAGDDSDGLWTNEKRT